jgi:serine/threonine-protein kinase
LLVPSRTGGKDSQFFYLVQEFIDGQTLADQLEAKGTFSESEIADIVEEILKVLAFVHQNSSIHRDIKPTNIMQHKNGQYFLLDFGAVKQVTKTSNNPQGQSTGIYSVGYAPPEQMMGKQVYPSTDLYALGVTAIHLLTGKPPEELYDAIHNVWQWRPEAPSVSDRFADFLDYLLQRNPVDRPSSAEEALKSLLGGSAIAHAATQLQTTQLPPAPPPPSSNLSPNVSSPVVSPQAASPPVPFSRFSSLEQMKMASFTGFQGALLSMGLISVLGMPGLVLACMAMGGLVFCQSQRIIEGKDFGIFAGLSLLLMLWSVLRGGLAYPMVVVIALVTGSAFVAVLILFKLVYQLVSRLLRP